MSEAVLQVEKWQSFWPAARELASAHFNEVEGPLAELRPFAPDEQQLETAANAGILLIITARIDEVLVGYCLWTMQLDPESKGLLIAIQGPWFHVPGAKIGGKKMISFSIEQLKALGVKAVFLHHRLLGRGANLAPLYESLGAVETQRTFFLWTGAENA